jgi:hypothetical protein
VPGHADKIRAQPGKVNVDGAGRLGRVEHERDPPFAAGLREPFDRQDVAENI